MSSQQSSEGPQTSPKRRVLRVSTWRRSLARMPRKLRLSRWAWRWTGRRDRGASRPGSCRGQQRKC
eukprot:3254501-Alexandrium_andersonii.AAC.1